MIPLGKYTRHWFNIFIAIVIGALIIALSEYMYLRMNSRLIKQVKVISKEVVYSPSWRSTFYFIKTNYGDFIDGSNILYGRFSTGDIYTNLVVGNCYDLEVAPLLFKNLDNLRVLEFRLTDCKPSPPQ